MATHLHEEGHPPLLVWNRSYARTENFVKECEDKGVPVAVAEGPKEVASSESTSDQHDAMSRQEG